MRLIIDHPMEAMVINDNTRTGSQHRRRPIDQSLEWTPHTAHSVRLALLYHSLPWTPMTGSNPIQNPHQHRPTLLAPRSILPDRFPRLR
jgi:hypothetical protein